MATASEKPDPTPVLKVAVWRGAAEGRYQLFDVPRLPSQTVLDVVTHIQRHLDATLSYRFACRVGMCGSCAMMVNGTPKWSCRAHVDNVAIAGTLRLAPLANMPVVKDLVADMGEFFGKWARAHGQFVPTATRADDFAVVDPQTTGRREADAGIECIGCGVCYAACDVVAWNREYLGPAALNRAWTLVNDVRDGGQGARLLAVAGDAGCHSCHTLMSCAEHCPKSLSPTRAISGLKRATWTIGMPGDEG